MPVSTIETRERQMKSVVVVAGSHLPEVEVSSKPCNLLSRQIKINIYLNIKNWGLNHGYGHAIRY
jgi:hypothetical protein